MNRLCQIIGALILYGPFAAVVAGSLVTMGFYDGLIEGYAIFYMLIVQFFWYTFVQIVVQMLGLGAPADAVGLESNESSEYARYPPTDGPHPDNERFDDASEATNQVSSMKRLGQIIGALILYGPLAAIIVLSLINTGGNGLIEGYAIFYLLIAQFFWYTFIQIVAQMFGLVPAADNAGAEDNEYWHYPPTDSPFPEIDPFDDASEAANDAAGLGSTYGGILNLDD